MFSLRKLPPPTIIEELSYEKIVERKLNKVKEILLEKGISYEPSEADDLMTLIEADAYDEMLLRASLNARIRQLFLAYATGSNLDHIGTTRFGIERLEGKNPTATVRFSISQVQGNDVVIPYDTLLGDGEHAARLLQSVIIRSGSMSAEGIIEFDTYVRQSDIKCETILTPLPWVVKATQTTLFKGGADEEEDDRYRERIWLGRERKSTAGSKGTYIYYAKSADVRVIEVSVRNGGAGIVDVAVLGEGFSTPIDLLKNVQDRLSSENVRPLTDTVHVQEAIVRNIAINATLYAKNVEGIDINDIKQRFSPFEGKFGTRLSIAKIYDLLQDDNIVDVSLEDPAEAIAAAWNETLKFNFSIRVGAAA